MEFIDPIILLAGGVALLLVWRFSGYRSRHLRKKRAHLRVAAGRETNPWRKREILSQWSELGGVQETRRNLSRRLVRDQGQKARVGGRRLSANPYGHGFWGKGRLWKLGWKAVDRHIRWIEKQR